VEQKKKEALIKGDIKLLSELAIAYRDRSVVSGASTTEPGA